MTLRNTSAYSDKQVWEALKHILHNMKLKENKIINLSVKNCGGNIYGRVYLDGCGYHTEDPFNPLIIARIIPNEA
jgi:hypothetical protein